VSSLAVMVRQPLPVPSRDARMSRRGVESSGAGGGRDMDDLTSFDERYAEAVLRLKHAVEVLQQAHGGGQLEAEQFAAFLTDLALTSGIREPTPQGHLPEEIAVAELIAQLAEQVVRLQQEVTALRAALENR
jgi:hypothetical protein